MLESLITSKTRIKLLLKFFANPETAAYLRELAAELGESTNAVRVELNRLSKAGLLRSYSNGRTKVYQANTAHTLFPELQGLARKFLGFDKIEEILRKLGSVELALITGDYARGNDTGIIDLVIVGEVDKKYLLDLTEKAERLIKRKIRSLVLTRDEYEALKERLAFHKALVLWVQDQQS